MNVKLGVAYNPYLKKYYKVPSERERLEMKISSGLINSIWFQYGTDIKLLQDEITYLKKAKKYNENFNIFSAIYVNKIRLIDNF